MEVNFKFSNDTFMSLSKTLVTFPKVTREKRPVIRFGETINDVSYEYLENLLRLTQSKVNIDLTGTDMQKIANKSLKYSRLLKTKEIHLLEPFE